MTTALARLGVAHGADLPYVTDEELEGAGLAPVQRRKLREAAAAAGGGAPAATSLLSPTSSAVQAMISDMSPVSSNPTANADHAVVDSSSADGGGGGSPPEADAKVDAAERRLEEVEAELRRERIMRADGEQTLQAEREVLAAMQQMQIAQTEERQRCDAVFVCCSWVGGGGGGRGRAGVYDVLVRVKLRTWHHCVAVGPMPTRHGRPRRRRRRRQRPLCSMRMRAMAQGASVCHRRVSRR